MVYRGVTFSGHGNEDWLSGPFYGIQPYERIFCVFLLLSGVAKHASLIEVKQEGYYVFRTGSRQIDQEAT
jgi:hypothetical protein